LAVPDSTGGPDPYLDFKNPASKGRDEKEKREEKERGEGKRQVSEGEKGSKGGKEKRKKEGGPPIHISRNATKQPTLAGWVKTIGSRRQHHAIADFKNLIC